jgi:hypothetical protein|nr:MAG TPA: hypothetical protein [Caudoviricetes sp.]
MKKNNEQESLFTKEQLLNSSKYKNRVDLLNVLLVDDKQYSLSEVEEKINKFMKRSV